MKIDYIGCSEKYLCEGLALIFFPNSDFKSGEDGRFAQVTFGEDKSGAFAKVSLTSAGKTECGEAHAADFDPLYNDKMHLICACFLQAGEKLTGYRPLWGSLTGIRPARIVKRFFSQGLSLEAAAKRLQAEFSVSERKARLAAQVAKTELAAEKSCGNNPISLYISIPFCPTRCSYCSFVSEATTKSGELMEPYVETLLRELSLMTKCISERGLSLETLYIGGGTPTALPPALLYKLFCGITENVNVAALREFTVEAGRPDTVTREKIELISQVGAGRISINPQTLSDRVLAEIGRRHTVSDYFAAMELARDFPQLSINCDLIAGLPSETPEEFCGGLDRVIGLKPDNITVHTLSVKRAARLKSEGDAILKERSGIGKMVDYSAQALGAAHYHPYYLYRQKNTLGNAENVGYAKVDKEGLYNIYIMGELHSIAAIGAGATAKFISPKSGYIERIYNKKYPKEYLESFEKEKGTVEKLAELYDNM